MDETGKGPETGVGTPSLRAYSRVEAYLPMTVEPVPASERPYVKSRVCRDLFLVDFGCLPDPEGEPGGPLEEIHQKVDRVVEMLTLRCGGFHALPFQYLSISGGGVKFSHPQPFARGEILEFKLILSIVQPVALYLYGEVIGSERQTDGYYVAARFIQTDDRIRDLIVRFVFETERGILREQKR